MRCYGWQRVSSVAFSRQQARCRRRNSGSIRPVERGHGVAWCCAAQGAEQHFELPTRPILQLTLAVGAADDAGAHVQVRLLAADHAGAQRDREVGVTARIDPADGAAIPAALVRLVLGDEAERRRGRVAAYSGRRMDTCEQRQRALGCAQGGADRCLEVQDVPCAVRVRSSPATAGDPATGAQPFDQVSNHRRVLGEQLGVAQQLLGRACVAGRQRAGDGFGLDVEASFGQQTLGGRTDERRAVDPKSEARKPAGRSRAGATTRARPRAREQNAPKLGALTRPFGTSRPRSRA